MPKISIIIPVYRVEEFIHKCVDSIIGQSYDDYEIILVDDGSPDRCPEICDEYARQDPKISVIHKENGGLSSARNAGLAQASGEYIWFVDSDDYLLDDSFEKILPYFEKDADILNFGFVNDFESKLNMDDKSRFNYTGFADHKTVCGIVSNSFARSLFTYIWRNIYRAEFLRKNDMRFTEGLSYAEDGIFNSKAFLIANGIYFADEYIYVYRYRSDGLSKNVEEKLNLKYFKNIEEYNMKRDEHYQKYCRYPEPAYYANAGKFVLEKVFQYMFLPRIYRSREKRKYTLFKRVASSRMMKTAFTRFNIYERKGKSLDFLLLWFVRHKLYFAGHLLCKYVLYKQK